ncbi:gp184 [Sphingomonas phage PAU]|uniref:gp184 n=1 Tax=Sphingomonas phage PAU TaxID=1150991 RepID=UPI0002573356|nr:gp184 [Sphingomonas phage PAU]AFF28182.1 gp184 [Sphingomonas phage PAU]
MKHLMTIFMMLIVSLTSCNKEEIIEPEPPKKIKYELFLWSPARMETYFLIRDDSDKQYQSFLDYADWNMFAGPEDRNKSEITFSGEMLESETLRFHLRGLDYDLMPMEYNFKDFVLTIDDEIVYVDKGIRIHEIQIIYEAKTGKVTVNKNTNYDNELPRIPADRLDSYYRPNYTIKRPRN